MPCTRASAILSMENVTYELRLRFFLLPSIQRGSFQQRKRSSSCPKDGWTATQRISFGMRLPRSNGAELRRRIEATEKGRESLGADDPDEQKCLSGKALDAALTSRSSVAKIMLLLWAGASFPQPPPSITQDFSRLNILVLYYADCTYYPTLPLKFGD